jgi:DNA-binding SARP family transcriptional activator/TolB-like protein
VTTRLFTLGRIDLRVADGSEVRSLLAQPKRLALLVYLAASGVRFHRRDSLVALFWPEAETESARASLRTALSLLRRSLGDGVVVTRGNEEVGIDAEQLWCDVVAFEQALSAGDLEPALDLYAGDFLGSFHVAEAPEFARWMDRRRAELGRKAADAAWGLTELAEVEGNPGLAARWARRAMALNPDDEAGVRRLIGLLDRTGDRAGALRVYEAFAERLRSELEAEPAPETRELVLAIRGRVGGLAVPTETARDDTSAEEPPTGGKPVTEENLAGAPVVAFPEVSPGASPGAAGTAGRAAQGRPWSAGRLAVVGAVVILALAATSLVFAPSQDAAATTPRVAVIPFENRTGDAALDPLGSMAADWITNGLAETGLVEVVTLATMLASWSHVSADAGESHTAVGYRAVAEDTGAGTLVTGSFYRHADSISFKVRVTEAASGRIIRTAEPVVGAADAPLEAVEILRTRVLGVLATLFDPRLAMTTASASRPPTWEAYRAYLEGTERFIRLEHAAAIPFYELAAALDPDFAHPRIFLAICLHNTGNLVRADSVARTLDVERHRLAAFDLHLLDWLLAWIQGHRLAALEGIRRATDLVATSEWLYVHALSAHQANRPAESVESLRRLDPERGFMRGFVAYWTDLTSSHHLLGEHRAELRAAEQARRQYPQDMMALRSEVRALAALGRVHEVGKRIEESLILPPKYGVDPAVMMRVAASELRAHGHRRAAEEVTERAIVWHRTRPPEERRSAGHRMSLGEALYLAGRWEEARSIFAELAHADPASLAAVGHLGVIAARLGDGMEARRIDGLLAEFDRPFLHGAHTYWRARIAAVAGEREHAVRLLRDSFAEGRPFGTSLHAEMDFEPIRDHPGYRELLRPKG